MKIKHRFDTQAEADRYLRARGWAPINSTGSRPIYTCADSGRIGNRFLVRLRTNKWRIERV